MKSHLCFVIRLLLSMALIAPPAFAAQHHNVQISAEELVPIENAILELLRSGDVKSFAGIAMAEADWASAAGSTNTGKIPEARDISRDREEVLKNAAVFVQKAKELKLDFAGVPMTVKAALPRGTGTRFYADPDMGDLGWPYVDTLRIAIQVPSDATNVAERLKGEYSVIASIIKTPSGWRCLAGPQWTGFPAGAVNENTKVEIALMEKAASHKSLDMTEDPAVRKLAETLVESIRQRSLGHFESNAMITLDVVWQGMIEQVPEDKRPSREEFERQGKKHLKDQVASVLLFKQMEENGIDLKNAEIQIETAKFKSISARSGTGANGARGNQFEMTFNVVSKEQSAAGKSLTGKYQVSAGGAQRFDGRWFVTETLMWKSLPEGVINPETAAAINLEAYVAEHRTLPPGSSAPEIEFVRLSDNGKMKLSEFKGKVVVLDFWATWCGPCQGPMAKMQTYAAKHPEWKDKVEFVALSIDDTQEVLEQHLKKNDWNKTFNVWAGDGGWQASPPKAFRVRSVPTCYILDAEGKIVNAGHPAGLRIEDIVKGLVK